MSVINVHSILEGSTGAETNTDPVVTALTPNTEGKRRNVFRCQLLPGNAIATRHSISGAALRLHLLGDRAPLYMCACLGQGVRFTSIYK